MPNAYDVEQFLKPHHVRTGDVLEVVNAGRIETKTFIDKQTKKEKNVTFLTIGVKLPDGSTKDYSPNKNTLNAIYPAWGNMTEKWVHKKLRVEIVKTLVGGNMIDLLIACPVESAILE